MSVRKCSKVVMSFRGPMVWSGGTLVTLGLLAAVLRLVGAHEAIPYLGTLAPLPYYGATLGAGVVGIFFVLAAPPERRASNRVRLDERPVREEMTLRPKDQAMPTTHGMGAPEASGRPGSTPAAPSPAAPAPAAPAPAASANPASANPAPANPAPAASRPPTHPTSRAPAAVDDPVDRDPEATGRQQTVRTEAHPRTEGLSEERPAWGAPRHPNDATAADAMPRRTEAPSPHASGPGTDPAAALPPADRNEGNARARARRSELMSRLEELEVKANQAKVRYGLGKVSAAGYRQYLAEVDRERMMIESELMETEEYA